MTIVRPSKVCSPTPLLPVANMYQHSSTAISADTLDQALFKVVGYDTEVGSSAEVRQYDMIIASLEKDVTGHASCQQSAAVQVDII